MIQIGLTGWGDHPDVYHQTSTEKDKLLDYSSHFPIVELDSTFYAIQRILLHLCKRHLLFFVK